MATGSLLSSRRVSAGPYRESSHDPVPAHSVVGFTRRQWVCSLSRRRCSDLFYWVLKTLILGPILRLLFRPWVEGEENIPTEGAAIFASNHQIGRASCR